MEWTHLRRYPRVWVDLPAVFTVNAQVKHSRILTLGGGGLFLANAEPIEIGTKLSVGFRPAKHLPHLEVEAEVRYLIPDKGMGVKFIAIDPAYRQKLMTFILHRLGNNRQSARATLAAQIEYAGGMQIGLSRNISVGGMFIEAKEPVAAGTHLKMRFNLDDGGPIIIVAGEVRYAVAKMGMGVRFVDISPADQKRINVYLTRHLTSPEMGGMLP